MSMIDAEYFKALVKLYTEGRIVNSWNGRTLWTC